MDSGDSDKPTALTFTLGRHGRPARPSETLALCSRPKLHGVTHHNITCRGNLKRHKIRLLSSTMKTTKEPRHPTHSHTVHVKRWLLLSVTIQQFTNRNGVTNTAVRAWRLAGTNLVPRTVSSLGRHIVQKPVERTCDFGRCDRPRASKERCGPTECVILNVAAAGERAKKGPN